MTITMEGLKRALIILNQCNTDGRIKVDREELKQAIKMASEAIRLYIPRKPISGDDNAIGYCAKCGTPFFKEANFCSHCGQGQDWRECWDSI